MKSAISTEFSPRHVSETPLIKTCPTTHQIQNKRAPFLCGVDHRRNKRCRAMIRLILFGRGAPCRHHTTCERKCSSACAWLENAGNWRARLVTLLCRSIISEWRRNGSFSRIALPMRRQCPRIANSAFAPSYCCEPQSKVASRKRQTAPSRCRSTRRPPFRGRAGQGPESFPDDS